MYKKLLKNKTIIKLTMNYYIEIDYIYQVIVLYFKYITILLKFISTIWV